MWSDAFQMQITLSSHTEGLIAVTTTVVTLPRSSALAAPIKRDLNALVHLADVRVPPYAAAYGLVTFHGYSSSFYSYIMTQRLPQSTTPSSI